jgi:predicted N-acetyltransferase YhbS
MKTSIRHEKSSDYPGIKKVNDLAFGQSNEGILIEKLRENSSFIKELSLIAELDGKIIGHILFFPIWIREGQNEYQSLALAPMSVIPEYQKKGIGSQLIFKGLETSRDLGFKSVIVLGHEFYYPKFGFAPASQWAIKAPFDVPDEVFMALELVPDGLKGISGKVQYPKEFEEVG